MARLVLVGDTGQLRAVEAGQPFLQLQRAGMTTVQMDEVRRQRNPVLRAAVLASRSGEPGKAVELLGSSMHEVAFDELGEEAARIWLALAPEARDRTLLLAPTHAHRAEINGTIRAELADEGVLRGKALTIERLVSLGMTGAEKGDVRNYREGDAVMFHQDMVNYRVRKDEALTVTGIEGERVALRHPDGGPRHIKPAGRVRYDLEVYETRPIEIRAGDRIRWTRNDHGRGLINGERAEVAAIARGRVRLVLEDGRKVSLRAEDPQLRHIDYAWSSTVRGAQGSTADGVIAVLDTSQRALTDQSTFYVEISRARDRAVVLTDNLDELVEVLEANTGERATALDAVGEPIEDGRAGAGAPDSAEGAALDAWRGMGRGGGAGAPGGDGGVPRRGLRCPAGAGAGADGTAGPAGGDTGSPRRLAGLRPRLPRGRRGGAGVPWAAGRACRDEAWPGRGGRSGRARDRRAGGVRGLARALRAADRRTARHCWPSWARGRGTRAGRSATVWGGSRPFTLSTMRTAPSRRCGTRSRHGRRRRTRSRTTPRATTRSSRARRALAAMADLPAHALEAAGEVIAEADGVRTAPRGDRGAARRGDHGF